MAAQVRSNVLESVGGLIPIFSDVEVFLSTFQGDVSILNISLELAVATLVAIERAIGFFLKNECKLRHRARPSSVTDVSRPKLPMESFRLTGHRDISSQRRECFLLGRKLPRSSSGKPRPCAGEEQTPHGGSSEVPHPRIPHCQYMYALPTNSNARPTPFPTDPL